MRRVEILIGATLLAAALVPALVAAQIDAPAGGPLPGYPSEAPVPVPLSQLNNIDYNQIASYFTNKFADRLQCDTWSFVVHAGSGNSFLAPRSNGKIKYANGDGSLELNLPKACDEYAAAGGSKSFNLSLGLEDGSISYLDLFAFWEPAAAANVTQDVETCLQRAGDACYPDHNPFSSPRRFADCVRKRAGFRAVLATTVPPGQIGYSLAYSIALVNYESPQGLVGIFALPPADGNSACNSAPSEAPATAPLYTSGPAAAPAGSLQAPSANILSPAASAPSPLDEESLLLAPSPAAN